MKLERKAAEIVNELMIDLMARCDDSVRLVMETSDPSEAALYRKAIGRIMGVAVWDILNHIHADYPDLKPHHFKDD